MQKKLIIATGLLFVVIIALGALVIWPSPQKGGETATTTPSEHPFTSANIKVSTPLPQATVQQTFNVKGFARGTWYFEASFPVQVRDKDNNKVGQGIAQAEGDWMTTEFVPFVAHVTVTGYTGPATLVLLKDNPSGLPENEDSVEFPVVVH